MCTFLSPPPTTFIRGCCASPCSEFRLRSLLTTLVNGQRQQSHSVTQLAYSVTPSYDHHHYYTDNVDQHTMSYQYPIELMLLHKCACQPVLITFFMVVTLTSRIRNCLDSPMACGLYNSWYYFFFANFTTKSTWPHLGHTLHNMAMNIIITNEGRKGLL